MDRELSPLTVVLVTIVGRLSGMLHDPVFIGLFVLILAAGIFSRAWWLVPLASLGLPAFIYYRNWSWWQEIGVHRGVQDFVLHAAIVCLAFAIAFGVGRLISLPFRSRSTVD